MPSPRWVRDEESGIEPSPSPLTFREAALVIDAMAHLQRLGIYVYFPADFRLAKDIPPARGSRCPSFLSLDLGTTAVPPVAWEEDASEDDEAEWDLPFRDEVAESLASFLFQRMAPGGRSEEGSCTDVGHIYTVLSPQQPDWGIPEQKHEPGTGAEVERLWEPIQYLMESMDD